MSFAQQTCHPVLHWHEITLHIPNFNTLINVTATWLISDNSVKCICQHTQQTNFLQHLQSVLSLICTKAPEQNVSNHPEQHPTPSTTDISSRYLIILSPPYFTMTAVVLSTPEDLKFFRVFIALITSSLELYSIAYSAINTNSPHFEVSSITSHIQKFRKHSFHPLGWYIKHPAVLLTEFTALFDLFFMHTTWIFNGNLSIFIWHPSFNRTKLSC